MSPSDYSTATFARQPGALASLISAGEKKDRLWRPEELGAIFQHQLSAPMEVDLGRLPPGAATRLKHLVDGQQLLLKSFSELFHHPAPPIELLELTKDFAKANRDHPESVLPGEVAAAFYFLSIAAAHVRLGTRISRLGDDSLREGWLWARDREWIDDKTKALLTSALETLAPRGTKTGP